MSGFVELVRKLSSDLQKTYGLIEDRRSETSIRFSNEFISVSFYAGDVRDHFVTSDITANDKSLESLAQGQDIRTYADMLGVDRWYFPTWQESTENLRTIGSELQLIEHIIFLGTQCGEILSGDRQALSKCNEIIKQAELNYQRNLPQ